MPRRKIFLVACVLTLSGSACLAQEKPDAPAAKPNAASTAQNQQSSGQPDPLHTPAPSSAAQPAPDENPKRILDIIPNFQTTNQTMEYQPLTPREKYVLAYHQTVDFSVHFGNLFQAALQQASNGQPHYGQGWGAYAQRFGAGEADQVTSSFFIFGLLPHLLKEDPRYFRKGRPTRPLARIAYAATRTVITRTDSGGHTFNTPQVLGQLLQQGISTAYYPQQDRTVSGVFQNWGINLSYNSAYNVLKEYYPDFLRWTFRRHPKQRDLSANPPSPASPTPAPASKDI